MKRFRPSSIILSLLLTMSAAYAQDGRDGTLFFESLSHDFGTIEESAGPVSHSFVYVNTSGKDIFITSALPSCSCTTAAYEGTVLPSGAAGEIKVTYDPAALPGPFRQNVLVRTSNKDSYRLYIEGVVKERDKGRDELYPYFLTDGLQVSGLDARFGFVPQASVAEKHIGLVNTSSSTLRLSWRPEHEDSGLKVSLPESLLPGQTAEMVISYDIAKGRLGTLDNSITLTASGHEASRSIALSGYAVHGLGAKAGSPSFRFEPTMIRWDGRKKADITIHNDGRESLLILKLECSPGLSIELPEGTSIPGGGSLKVRVRNDSPRSGAAEGRIRFFTNDPSRPARDIICK